jgi:hypothetical protein
MAKPQRAADPPYRSRISGWVSSLLRDIAQSTISRLNSRIRSSSSDR